ncbi:TIGR04282 family arsenosugar biosynthesis glycosyltransferase [Mariniflexile gromovii]|uniref:TIGR04282 family arsenosugar biosynthesis glycosyltransferase n=1 Tax=Mariniflexile gromovii TaxID=362523 RepID=A0ABS4BSF1_9FLAO|nr:TIGR04282 family arsenosugar biosynthesis glycosyltransferase [Mariniflexile gromovii]MBP0903504.1 TIGR04282 family arsenosugar biosynthesis glycosyltransferase [Mariniflexile gromovii]
MGLISTKDTENDNEITFHFPTSKKALIVFTRNPELGKCKTRLAKTVGDKSALEIYKHLLKYTANIAKNTNADKYVFYSETIQKNDLWDASIFRKKLQEGPDLGEKMQNAFSYVFSLGYQKVIIIGSDLLDLTPKHIQLAFEALDKNNVVIGPAKDGGYYLLGMTSINQNLFKNKAWGTSTVLKDTLNELQKSNVFLLEELNDIDTFEDMEHYQELEKYYKND